MLGNPNFTKESVLEAHRDATVARMEYDVVLAVQDTMSVNYSGHKKTEGLGYNCEQSLGINVHSCLALSPDGIPLGLLSQTSITRAKRDSKEKTGHQKRQRKIEDKESYRWLETMKTAAQNAPANKTLIHIADREGDIYEFFEFAEKINEKFIVRFVQNRLNTDGEHIISALLSDEVKCKHKVALPRDPKKGTHEREVNLSVRYQNFKVKKPKTYQNNHDIADSVALNLISVTEETPPSGCAPVEWILATNCELNSCEDALKLIGYYKQRWKIERFHFVLKSGCEIEKIQQHEVGRIEAMILMYSVIAVHIMQLTYISRNHPDTPCDLVFDEQEWKTLYKAANRTKEAPREPYSMETAVRYVACLGGFKGAKSDGAPGLKVIWLGLNIFYALLVYRDFL